MLVLSSNARSRQVVYHMICTSHQSEIVSQIKLMDREIVDIDILFVLNCRGSD